MKNCTQRLLDICICSILLFILNNVLYGQEVHYNPSETDTITIKQDTLPIFTDEQIKQAMQFGVTEKVSSVVLGGYFGLILGTGVGYVIVSNNPGYAFHGFVYGGGAGILAGAIGNYFIIRALARKEARERLEASVRAESE